MTVSERQPDAKIVVQFYSEIENFNKYETFKHFIAGGLEKLTMI